MAEGVLQRRRLYRRIMRFVLGRFVVVRQVDEQEWSRMASRFAGRDLPAGRTRNQVRWGAYLFGSPDEFMCLVCNPPDHVRLPGYWSGGLFVRPGLRGLGIAERLRVRVMSYAFASGADAVYSWTSPENRRVLAMNAKMNTERLLLVEVVDDPALTTRVSAYCKSPQLVLRSGPAQVGRSRAV